MKVSYFVTAFMALYLQPASAAIATQKEMEQLFQNSRYTSAQMVSGTLECQIRTSGLPPNTTAFLLDSNNRQLLAQDILSSPHSWSWGNYQACSTTLNRAGAPLEFSFASCGSVQSVDDAARILLEQSLYHSGITDSGSIQAAAQFFVGNKPSCNPPAAPFDPSICPRQPMTADDMKSYMEPGQWYKQTGKHSLYLRSRTCNAVTGCAGWKTPLFNWLRGDFGWRDTLPPDALVISVNGNPPKIRADHEYLWGKNGKLSLVAYTTPDSNRQSFQVSVALADGGIYRSCSWILFTGRSSLDATGSYSELEAVYYGTH